MAKGMYTGVDGVSRKVRVQNVGIDNVDRKVRNGYVGVDNVSRNFFGVSALSSWSFYTETLSPYSTMDAYRQEINAPSVYLEATVNSTVNVNDGRFCVGLCIDATGLTGQSFEIRYRTNGHKDYCNGYVYVMDSAYAGLVAKYLDSSTYATYTFTIPNNAKYINVFVNCGAIGTHTISMDIADIKIGGVSYFS